MTDLGLGDAVAINDAGVVAFNRYTSATIRGALWSSGAVTDVGSSGAPTRIIGLNKNGQVIGVTFGSGNVTRGFFWDQGRATDLGTLGGTSTTPSDLNDSGEVTGTSTTDSGATHAFRWKNGVMTDLGTIGGGTESRATEINNAGMVAGVSNGHVFTWREGEGMKDLGTIPRFPGDMFGGVWERVEALGDNGRLVAVGGPGGYYIHHSFLRSGHEWIDLYDPANPRPLQWTAHYVGAMNDAGQIAGNYSFAGGTLGYFYENGVTSYIGVVDRVFAEGKDVFSAVTGMNAAGEVVGYSYIPNRSGHGFVWKGGTMIPLPPLSGTEQAVPRAINGSGRIVGTSAGHVVLWTKVQARALKR